MSKFKICVISVVSIILVLYSAFLFLLPNVINLNSYKKDIDKIISENINVKADYSNIKLYTTPSLAIGIKTDDISVSYPDDSKLFSAKNFDMRLSLLPLIFKNISISKFNLSEPTLYIDIINSKQYKFQDLLTSANKTSNEENKQNNTTDFDFTISLKNAQISNYTVSMNDISKQNNLTLRGEYFNIDRFISDKKIKMSTKGKVLLNNEDNINFDVNIDTFLPKLNGTTNAEEPENTESEFVNIVDIFKSYDLKSDINTNLKISSSKRNTEIKGNTDINNISFILNNKRLPDSNVNLKFENNEAIINSALALTNDEKFNLNGKFNFKNKQNLKLNCKSDKIKLSSIFSFIDGLLSSIAINSGLDDFEETGYLLSDFSLDTDFKSIKSNGYIKIADGKIKHRKTPLLISDLILNVDMSGNSIKINDTYALINGTKLSLAGSVDSNSTVDIKAYTDKLPIASLFNSFAPSDIRKSYSVQNGLLSMNLSLKGKINKFIPSALISLDNLSIKDLINNITLNNKQIKTTLSAQDSSIDGKISSLSTIVRMPAFNLTIQNPQTAIEISKDNIELLQTQFFINETPLDFSGSIKNYLTKPEYNFLLTGGISTVVLNNVVPKEYRALIKSKGTLPLIAKIEGNSNKIVLNSQILANQNNYFSPITINKIINKSTVVNAEITLEDNSLSLNDIGLYELHSNITGLNNALQNNISDAYRIAQITGDIKNLNKSVQTLDNIKINLPAALSVSTPLSQSSKMLVKGSLSLTGTTKAPVILGSVNVSDIALPEFSLNATSVDANMNSSNINIKAENISVDNSKFNCELNAKPVFSNGFDITSLNLTSSNIDTDRLLIISDKLMKKFDTSSEAVSKPVASTNTADIPVTIRGGNIKIDKLTSGELLFTDIYSKILLNKNIVKLPSLKLTAYNGSVEGSVDYNLISTLISANLKGNSIDANGIITKAAQLPDQIFGTLSFDANVKLSGATYLEQVKSLKGDVNFNITDGKLGSLGSLETFLKADNLTSQQFVSSTIGSILNTIVPYNSSQFTTLNGKLAFKNGITTIKEIKSSGENMSLYLDGTFNLVNNHISSTILGRLSEKLSTALGPISSLSTDKMISSIPGVGSYALTLFKTFTVCVDDSLLKKIPSLTSEGKNTKEFKVVLSGNVENPAKVVKSFKWLEPESEYKEVKQNLSSLSKDVTDLQKQAKDLVDTLLNKNTTQSGEKENSSGQSSKSDMIQKGVGNLLNLLSN